MAQLGLIQAAVFGLVGFVAGLAVAVPCCWALRRLRVPEGVVVPVGYLLLGGGALAGAALGLLAFASEHGL